MLLVEMAERAPQAVLAGLVQVRPPAHRRLEVPAEREVTPEPEEKSQSHQSTTYISPAGRSLLTLGMQMLVEMAQMVVRDLLKQLEQVVSAATVELAPTRVRSASQLVAAC